MAACLVICSASLLTAIGVPCRNPADVGGRMMTFTYVALFSGIVSWGLPAGADSMFNRMSVSRQD